MKEFMTIERPFIARDEFKDKVDLFPNEYLRRYGKNKNKMHKEVFEVLENCDAFSKKLNIKKVTFWIFRLEEMGVSTRPATEDLRQKVLQAGFQICPFQVVPSLFLKTENVSWFTHIVTPDIIGYPEKLFNLNLSGAAAGDKPWLEISHPPGVTSLTLACSY